jgi:hypothetical protein
MDDLFKTGTAILSACGLYRYRLTRRWADRPTCGFIMLNPSTADASQDDPTIRRCIGFAKREHCGALIVVNLFAFRATKPAALLDAADPVGPNADHELLDAIAEVDGPLIAAWGSWAYINPRAADITAMIGRHCVCLGKTIDGHPRHPLYVKGDAPLIPLLEPTPC